MSDRAPRRSAGGHAAGTPALLSLAGPLLVAGLLVLLVGCSGAGDGSQPPAGPCRGLEYDDVAGPRPAYAGDELDHFANDEAMCHGLWLPRAKRWFTPQGIALDDRTAWVSGYRWRPGYGNRPCQLMQVNLRTGRELAFQPRVEGAVGDGPPVWCRHGGGLAKNRHGLWLAETGRLWLLDPARVGTGDAVLRAWRLDRPVSGGFLVAGTGDDFALGDFHLDHDSTAHWYRFSDLLEPGVTALVAGPATTGQVAARDRTGAPRYAQGGAVRSGMRSPYLTSSVTTCGLLVTPDGNRIGFAPGAEGIAFDGRGGLWAALESGSRGYQRQDRPLTPMLARFDLDQLTAGRAEDCGW